MNILSGYMSSGYQEYVTLNGAPRDLISFRNVSSYIMQDDSLQLYLIVQESMEIDMKLKNSISELDVQKIISMDCLLHNLLLHDKRDSLVNNLSGGECRRLTIALELVCSPKVMFFDEPKTGLDIVSADNVVKLMRKLADWDNHNMHYTSSFSFSFDTVLIRSGQCIYNGKSSQIIDHFSDLGFQCPVYHNPADYVIELSLGEYGIPINTMIELAKEQSKNDRHIIDQSANCVPVIFTREHSSKCFPELCILMHRNLLITFRDHFLVKVRRFVHLNERYARM